MSLALKVIGTALAAIVLAVVIGVAGWQFGWWLKAKNIQKRGQIIDQSYNHQVGLRQQVLDSINDLTIHADMPAGQKVRITATTCDAIDQMLDQYKTRTIVAFAATNC